MTLENLYQAVGAAYPFHPEARVELGGHGKESFYCRVVTEAGELKFEARDFKTCLLAAVGFLFLEGQEENKQREMPF